MKNLSVKFKLLLFSAFFILVSFNYKKLPKGFVDVTTIIPDLKVDLQYLTKNNFVGKPINGYKKNRCILTLQATNALKKVQDELLEQNLCLQIYDAYRPQKAVNHFIKWAKDFKDTINKTKYYPKVKKRNLFKLQYIASHSRHSSGSTVDLTIYSDKTDSVLDMGSDYDYFGKKSWVNYQNLTKEQLKNRQLLQTVMLNNGFRSYPKEWWHFTLRYEPFRNQYFDFDIE